MLKVTTGATMKKIALQYTQKKMRIKVNILLQKKPKYKGK